MRVQSQFFTRGIEEWYDNGTKPGEKPIAGRAWMASELRRKSFADLHKLWYILLKEKHMLYTEKVLAKQEGRDMQNPARLVKVKKSMARVKTVLGERSRLFSKAKNQVKQLLSEQKQKIMKETRKSKILTQIKIAETLEAQYRRQQSSLPERIDGQPSDTKS